MDKKKKVRLSDIAEKLNISTVTVSKALANKDGVGEELRKQIKDMAEEMGYKVKKTNANSNSDQVTGNIGILIPARFFSNDFSFYWYLFNFLSKELLSRNYYSIMELLSDEDETKLTMPRMIQDQKVDGMIILGQTNDTYLDLIKSHYDNFILMDFYTNKLHLDSVSDDDY
ncbi:MAG: LacI family DNA-binding transcriptional regulator [Treponema sp.]|nr:LacI family DNA-binding transcriptional regulator [Treponema sp.]